MRSLALPLLTVVVATATLTGCRVPQKLNSYEENKQLMVAPADRATMVFYAQSLGNRGLTIIDENSTCLAFANGYEMWPSHIAPGKHSLVLLIGNGKTKAFNVELGAGKTYIFKVEPDKATGDPDVTPMKIATDRYSTIDNELYQLKSLSVEQEKCAQFLKDVHPGWEELIAKTKATVANQPPQMIPTDGAVWQGDTHKTFFVWQRDTDNGKNPAGHPAQKTAH
jgi:hypothetical protein